MPELAPVIHAMPSLGSARYMNTPFLRFSNEPGQRHELCSTLAEHVLECRGQKKLEFTFAAEGHRISRHELIIAIARVTHDEMALARRAKIAAEIGGIIASCVEC